VIFYMAINMGGTTLYVFTFQRNNVDGEIYATETIFLSYKLFFTCESDLT
jgi:hypothetical protein